MSNSRSRKSSSQAPANHKTADDREQTLSLTPEEQLAFWNALAAPPPLTETQRRLGTLMRDGA